MSGMSSSDEETARQFRTRHQEQYQNYSAMKARGFDTDYWWETVVLPQFDAAKIRLRPKGVKADVQT